MSRMRLGLLAGATLLASAFVFEAQAQNAQFVCDQNGQCGGADVMRMMSTRKAPIGASSSYVGPAFDERTRVVLLVCSVACHVVQGISGQKAATTNDFLLPANSPLRLRIQQGDGIAVIRSSSDGTAYVVEMQ